MDSYTDLDETVLRCLSSLRPLKNKVLDKSNSLEPKRGSIKCLLRHENILDQERSVTSNHFEAIFAMFLKLSYFIGITPYHIKTVVRKNEHIVETSSNRFQMILVLAVHIWAISRFAYRLSELPYNINNPVNYFKVARIALSISSCLFFLWSLWMRRHKCEALLNRLANFSFYQNTTTFGRKWAQVAFFIICIGLMLVTSLYRTIAESGDHLEEFCKDNRYGQQIVCNNGKYRHLKILALQSLYVFGNVIGRNLRRISRVQFLVIALTLWQLCKSFSNSIRRRNDCQSVYQNREIISILSAYEELKEISNLICDLISETLITEIGEDIVYFTLEVQLSMRSADWLAVLIVFETWITAFLAYFIAANAEEHIQTFNAWLSRDDVIGKLSPGKITILSAQLTARPIGMKGGSLFTITKGFLANVVTVWATYFIILLQFHLSLGNDVKSTGPAY